MDAPRRVKQPTVLSTDERAHHGGTIRACQTLERRLPRAVGERSADPRVSHFAGGKHHERASLAQPQMRCTQPGTAPRCRIAASEWIDEETGIVELWNAIEEAIGEDSDIRTNAPHDVEKQ